MGSEEMKISYKLEKLLAAVASAIGLSVSIYVIVLAVGGPSGSTWPGSLSPACRAGDSIRWHDP